MLVRVSYLLILSYIDLVTDMLVCKDYWDNRRKQLAYASGGCIMLVLFVLSLTTFFQY